MQIRTIAAALNGMLVLLLYVAAWGIPSFAVAALEVGLSAGAAVSTWYALRCVSTRAVMPHLTSGRAKARA